MPPAPSPSAVEIGPVSHWSRGFVLLSSLFPLRNGVKPRSAGSPGYTEASPTPREPAQGRRHCLRSPQCVVVAPGNVIPDASSESKFFSDPSEKAALTIQTHFRRYQQQKQEKK